MEFANRVNRMKPSAIREILKLSSDPGIIAFSAGNPSPESFPVEDIERYTTEILQQNPVAALQYGLTEGYLPLRGQLKDFAKTRAGAFDETRDELIVTTGAQQILDFMAKVLVNEGDTIIAEGPSFVGALSAFQSYGANIVQLDIGAGLQPEALEQAIIQNSNVRFVYLIPNFQNPSGLTMPLETRKQVLAVAKKHNVLILEDNPYGELRFAGADVPTLKSLDADGVVVYAGSMSKILSPGLRIGFVSGPKEIIAKLTVAKQVSDVHTPLLNQMICSRFLGESDVGGHIENIRTLYKHKAEWMLACFDNHCSGKFAFTRPEGGLFIWCTLPETVDMPDFCLRAVKRGVAVVPGNAFYADDQAPCYSFRVNFSSPSDEAIENGAKILGELAAEMLSE